MNLETVWSYLEQLEANNQREWYHAHKAEYGAANAEFEELVRRLLLEVREFDASIPLAEPRELTFKLMRDTRFSHDKSPYNPAFRAHLGPQGKLPIPVGYYLMLRPGGRSFLGGGLFAEMFKDATTLVRDAIAADGEGWLNIVNAPGFAERFTVGGAALKQVPRGYDAAHPAAEYLKNKSWYLEYPVTDAQVLAPGFPEFAAGIFAQMQPFNAFLNKALEPFVMPQR